ncbi:MAG: thiopurine S-methyltransferase [Pseudomonadota bacterium]
MERDFWLERWHANEIGFHQAEVNPWLKQLWPAMGVKPEQAVFVPLCGKSLDMLWLAEQGHRVIGVELAEVAVRAFFDEAGRNCRLERQRHLQRFTSDGIAIYCGDFMDLTALHVGHVGAVYDRAALIALPEKMRAHYADHLQRIVPDGCRMLMLTLEYDQSRVAGPPHSVPEAEVEALFGDRCRVERLRREPARALPPKFAEAGVDDAVAAAYRVTKIR